nr:MAG TPA: hypothetical protein [Caudoviricetes sp.]
MHKPSTALMLRTGNTTLKGLTGVRIGPILIYRKEDRKQEPTGPEPGSLTTP